MNKAPTRKDVLRSLRKAERALSEASALCADADAMVATYWKSKLRPWRFSKDLRAAAQHAHALSFSLLLLLGEDQDSPLITDNPKAERGK